MNFQLLLLIYLVLFRFSFCYLRYLIRDVRSENILVQGNDNFSGVVCIIEGRGSSSDRPHRPVVVLEKGEVEDEVARDGGVGSEFS